jgi:aspartate ammonia-lyase
MGDIVRSDQSEAQQIVEGRQDLQLKQLRILLAEKEAQSDGLAVAITKLKSVELQKLELNQDIVQEQIKNIRGQIVSLARMIGGDTEKTVDAEFTVVDE